MAAESLASRGGRRNYPAERELTWRGRPKITEEQERQTEEEEKEDSTAKEPY